MSNREKDGGKKGGDGGKTRGAFSGREEKDSGWKNTPADEDGRICRTTWDRRTKGM